jgi:hypothetical protein
MMNLMKKKRMMNLRMKRMNGFKMILVKGFF